MTNPEVAVGVRADTAPLAPGMQQAASVVEQAAQQMRDSFEQTREQSSNAMSRMRDNVKAANDEMVKSFGRLIDIKGMVVRAMGQLIGALASGAFLRASIREVYDLTDNAEKLGRQLGITATEAGVLRTAIDDAYIPADQFDAAVRGLTLRLRTNRDEIEAMGVRTRETNGETRNMRDILLDALRAVEKYKEGTDRNLAAQVFFGRGVSDVSRLVELNSQRIDDAREKQRALQSVVGEQNVRAFNAYKAAMNDAGDVMSAVRKVTGEQLMPMLTDLANWFASTGPAAVQYIKTSLAELTTVIRAVGLVANAIETIVVAAFESMGTAGATYARAAWQAITLDFKGAGETLSKGFQSVRDRAKGVWEGVVADAKEFRSKIEDAWSTPTPTAEGKSDGQTFEDPNGNNKPAESQLGKYEELLTRRKNTWDRINELDGTFYEFGKAREAAFWKDILDHERLSQEDRVKIERRYFDARGDVNKEGLAQQVLALRAEDQEAEKNFGKKVELARRELALMRERYGEQSKEAIAAQMRLSQIERDAASQRDQITASRIKSAEDEATTEVKIAEEAAKREYDLGRITKDELLLLEAEFEQRKYEIRRQAAEAALALVDPERDPVEFERRSEQLLQLEREYGLRRAQLMRQQATEGMKPMAVAGRAFEASWAASLDGLLKRTMTWGDAVRNIFTGTVSAIIMEIAKIPARWIVNMLTEKAIRIKEILNNATVAASGAYAATAAIPIVGPMLAPGAASLAYANVSAMTAGIAVARRGYDIPAGVNPLVQAHEREMILPAEIAEPVREMVATGGGQRRGGDTIHIHAMDARSFEQFLRRNPTALSRAGREAYRDGR